MSRQNKILIAIGIILVLILIILFFIWQNQVNPKTGEPRTLGDYLPFGQNNSSSTANTSDTQDSSSNQTQGNFIPKLRQVSKNPVAGAETLEQKDGTTLIRYIERSAGNVFDTETTSLSEKRISNTTIPKNYGAFWIEKGDSLILRSLKEGNDAIQTTYARLASMESGWNSSTTNTSTTTTTSANDENSFMQLVVSFLPSNIQEIVSSPKKDKVFYLNYSGTGSVSSISNADGSKPAQIWSSPLKEWQISWPKDDTILLTTKPSFTAPGYLFSLNTKTGVTQRILGDIYGLTALANSDLSKIAISQGNESRINFSIYDTKTGAFLPITNSTLPEKCVWSKLDTNILYCGVPTQIPNTGYPESWYMGITSFSDNIWRFNVKTGLATTIANVYNLSRKNLDVIKPFLTEKEDFLLFTNKKDSTLWSLDMRGEQIQTASSTTTN
jgi:hypothetical protein